MTNSNGSCPSNFAAITPATITIRVIALSLVGLLGFTGNIMVILVTLYRKKKNSISPTDYLIVNNAIIDVLQSGIKLPLLVVNVVANCNALGLHLCEFHGFLTGICFIGSAYSLATLAVFRYLTICKSPGIVLHVRHSVYAIVAIWLITLFICLLPFWGLSVYEYNPLERSCLPSWGNNYANRINAAVELFSDFIIPLVITFFCYLKVFLTLRRAESNLARHTSVSSNRRNTMSNGRRPKQLTLALWFLVLNFLMCYITWSVIAFVVIPFSNGEITISDNFYFFAVIMLYVNSALNPFIYIIMLQSFRRRYVLLLKKIFCCHFINVHNIIRVQPSHSDKTFVG